MTQDNKDTLKMLLYRYTLVWSAISEGIDPAICSDLRSQARALEKKIERFIDEIN